MKPGDIGHLNALRSLRVTLLFTYSGIDDERIEPYPSSVAAGSLRLMSAPAERKYGRSCTGARWCPASTTPASTWNAPRTGRHADATCSGLFYRDQIAAYYRASGLPNPTRTPRGARSCRKHSEAAC